LNFDPATIKFSKPEIIKEGSIVILLNSKSVDEINDKVTDLILLE
jgi:hypothetical protein